MKLSAHCNPKCLNGGKCVSGNKCECPMNFSGAQCQTVTEPCAIRAFGFNGNYNCSGVNEVLSCSISCPQGIATDIQLAPIYKCNLTQGTFTPSPIPKCIYGEGVQVIQRSSDQGTPRHFAGNQRLWILCHCSCLILIIKSYFSCLHSFVHERRLLHLPQHLSVSTKLCRTSVSVLNRSLFTS